MPLQAPVFESVKFGLIRPWGKNPRKIDPEKLGALARSIEKYGLFQNLTCWKEGEEYVTGGGNMRYKAMKEVLKYPDDKLITVSVNFPSGEAEKIELSFLDNQSFGFYNELEVAELINPLKEELDLDFLSIEVAQPLNIRTVLENFSQDEGELPIIDVYDGIPNRTLYRVPISGHLILAGLGNYCGVMERVAAHEAIELLRKRYGESRKGREEAFKWVCSLIAEALRPEYGPVDPMPTEDVAIAAKRKKEKDGRAEAEEKELAEFKAQRDLENKSDK
jgi:hypothetical protein